MLNAVYDDCKTSPLSLPPSNEKNEIFWLYSDYLLVQAAVHLTKPALASRPVLEADEFVQDDQLLQLFYIPRQGPGTLSPVQASSAFRHQRAATKQAASQHSNNCSVLQA